MLVAFSATSSPPVLGTPSTRSVLKPASSMRWRYRIRHYISVYMLAIVGASCADGGNLPLPGSPRLGAAAAAGAGDSSQQMMAACRPGAQPSGWRHCQLAGSRQQQSHSRQEARQQAAVAIRAAVSVTFHQSQRCTVAAAAAAGRWALWG